MNGNAHNSDYGSKFALFFMGVLVLVAFGFLFYLFRDVLTGYWMTYRYFYYYGLQYIPLIGPSDEDAKQILFFLMHTHPSQVKASILWELDQYYMRPLGFTFFLLFAFR